jgi:hypothetical protein
MDAPDEAVTLDADGRTRTTLDDLAARGTITGRPDGGSWTLVHRCIVARARFLPARTEIRLGLSKNPVVQADGAIVLETAFPRDQVVLPPVARPRGIQEVRTALLTAVALSRPPRSSDAVLLLEAAAALVLGAAGHARGTLRTTALPGGWAVETPDGARHPLAKDFLSDPSRVSDLSAPAAVLHHIPWCGVDRRPTDGWTFDTTAHARLAAAGLVERLAPLYGLDPTPWISRRSC